MKTEEKLPLVAKLLRSGLPDVEIIRQLDISRASYYRLKKKLTEGESRKDKRYTQFNVKAYCDAILNQSKGNPVFESKDELAEMLGMSKPTLIGHESENPITELLCQYFHVEGTPHSQISKDMHLSKTKIAEYTQGVSTMGDIANALRMILGIYQVLAEFDKAAVPKISKLQQILNKIESL